MNHQSGESSGGYKKLAEMVWMWHRTAERFRYQQRQLEKLNCRWLTAVTGSDDVDAVCHRDLIPRSVGWKSSSIRYIGAAFESQNRELLLNLFRSFQPM